jgi:hypothetical protein
MSTLMAYLMLVVRIQNVEKQGGWAKKILNISLKMHNSGGVFSNAI